MAAVFSGNGLGVFDSSLSRWGLGFGDAAQAGQGRGSQYVNVANGNLVLQEQDEQLLFRGSSIAQLRTYNSSGTVAQAGADGWTTGFERRVSLAGGTLDAAGSVVRVSTGDGGYQEFSYAGQDRYVSSTGSGADDTLSWDATARTWTWVEGSSQRRMVFADHADAVLQGRLLRIAEGKSDGATPAAWDVDYDAEGRIAAIRGVDGGAAGDALVFGYDGSDRLVSLSTREAGVLRGQVAYEYDGLGRLSAVLVDLTPEDGVGDRDSWDATLATNNDGLLFRTAYTYDADSLRIAALTRSDGTVVSYTYDGSGRVRTVTRGDMNTDDGDGAGQTVTFGYDTAAGQTDVTDSAGRVWSYLHDAQGRLLQVTAPAISGLRDVTRYSYDAAGNLAQVRTSRGTEVIAQTDYAYDANGNRTWEWTQVDPANGGAATAIQRSYDDANQLLAETRYAGLDGDGADAAQAPTGGATTHYVYDPQHRLRFVVDAGGGVREYRYHDAGNGIGQQSEARTYVGESYGGGAYALADLVAWATDARAANSTLVETRYDLWGRVAQTRAYANVAADGSGIEDDAAHIVQYTYDAQGLLRQSTVLRSSTVAAGDGRDLGDSTSYVYDGMGRLLSEVAIGAGNVALRTSAWAYLDSAATLRTILEGGPAGDGSAANDLLRTQVRDAAGRLVSVTESAVTAPGVARTTRNYYDGSGQLRATEDAAGGRSYFFYDAKGDLVGSVDATGALTETVRDAAGRAIETRAYSVRLDTSAWLVDGQVAKTTLDEIRPGWSTDLSALPVAGLYTGQVDNDANGNAIRSSDGKLVFRRVQQDTSTWPSVYRTTSHGLEEGVVFSGEVTTGAVLSDTYLLFTLQNVLSGSAVRKVSASFRDGVLNKHTNYGGTGTYTPIASLQGNTTYVVRATTRDGRIDFTVFVKGQDPDTGYTFGVDADAREWGSVRLTLYAYGGPGEDGNPLYVDNLAESDPGIRTSRSTYDGAGRLLTSTDAAGVVTTYAYDGAGRLLQTRTDGEVARVTRNFHDAAGRLAGQLDAEGCLTEYRYDAAGRQVGVTRYATATDPALRASGTLAQLRPAAHGQDQRSRSFYDGRGQLLAELDAENYLTEYVYDDARKQRAERAYARRLTGLTGSESLSALRTQAQAGAVRETQRSYDALGRVLVERNAEGTVTRYTYDAAGHLLTTVVAEATSDVREANRRYDVFGNLIGELGGEGSTHLVPGMSESQLDALYAAYGVRHSYDALGNRTESIDAEGNKTWYAYDAVGRLTQTARGVVDAQGVRNGAIEVSETRYDAFGEVRDSVAYAGRFALAAPHDRGQVLQTLQSLRYLAGRDSRTQYDYDQRGLLVGSTDALGHRSTWEYSAFGDLLAQFRETDGGGTVATSYSYDRLGQRLSQTDDATGLARRQSWTYDAFGRVHTAVDGNGHTLVFGYDQLGRQVSRSRQVGGRAENWFTAYDAFDRVVTQTDASGASTTFAYDDVQRRMVATTAEGVVTTTVHTREGETWTVTDGSGATTEYRYDHDGRLVATIAPDQGTESRSYDARGLLIRSTDASGRAVAYSYDAAGRMATRTVDPDGLALATRYEYDGMGRQVALTDPLGVRTVLQYDAAGQLLSRTVDPDGLALVTTYAWDALGRQLSVTEAAGTAAAHTVAYAYDALGRRIAETVDPGAGKLALRTTYSYDDNDNLTSRTDPEGRVTRYTYDEANREVFVVDGAGGVRRTWYDVSGRMVATRAYAKAIDLASLALQASTAAVQARITSDDGHDLQQYIVYDRDGRQTLAIDGAGALAVSSRDAAGRLTGTLRRANAVALDADLRTALRAGTATIDDIAVAADAARDQQAFLVYDSAGRVRYTIAADGGVSEHRYDLAGRVTEEWGYATAIALSAADRTALAAGTLAPATIAQRVAVQAGSARVQVIVYDGAGRARYVGTRIDAAGMAVSERQYDAQGRLVAQIAYGVAIASPTARTQAAFAAALQSALSPDAGVRATQVRTTRYLHDAAGRQRFALDTSGALAETRYDAAGQVVATVQYGDRPAASAAASLASVESWAASHAGNARSTGYAYDAAGRLARKTDALGHAETYTYDGAGLLASRTDRNGKTWSYQYDAAGRQVVETSPQVTVASVDDAGTVTTVSRAIVTRTAYDGLGNVTSRSEDADSSAPRMVRYEYDNRGRQVRTIFPDAWKIDPATGKLVASGVQPDIRVTYDTLGRAVVQKDVLGHYSYKAYDQAGRIAYEVDQEGYVTAYAYDAFGEQTALRRHAQAANTGAIAGWSQGQPLTVAQLQASGVLATSAADRVLTTSYDQRGNKLTIKQAQVTYYNEAGTAATGTPTRQFAYDAYGQLIRESVLLEGTAGQANARWAETWHWYDALGRNTATVDAEGYLTRTEFNATGETVAVTEYARALDTDALSSAAPPPAPAAGDATVGYDRVTRLEYDALGRKTAEVALRHYQRGDGSAGMRDLRSEFGYDREGHLTTITSDAGTDAAAVISTTYDALGRAISVREPLQLTLTAAAGNNLAASTGNSLETAGLYVQASPYTVTAYDAFGNAVRVRRYANGWVEGTAGPASDAARDQIQITRYDRQGRAVWERNAEGDVVTRRYDAADNLLEVRYRLDGNDGRWAMVRSVSSYDTVGRQLTSQTFRDEYQDASGTSTLVRTSTDASEAVAYNAFGEITAKGRTLAELGSAATSQRSQYNAAGFMVASNAESGAFRRYGYNLAGMQVREERDWTDGGTARTAVYRYTVDRLGRATETLLPSHVADASVSTSLVKQYDRWGNVLQVVDARGYQTDYQYNQLNQVVREQRPLVYVVDETGAGSWQRPVNAWFYDAAGRLVGTRDANGNVRRNTLDEAGRLRKATDALGNSTWYAYDALGNQRFVQNALGYVTWKAYDRLGRVAAIGDYMPTDDGLRRASATLQAYTLNQNGDRIAVEDALHHVARYDYDSRNLLVQSRTAGNVWAGFAYDAAGRKVTESNGQTGTANFTDRDGEAVHADELSWDYDVFGRVTDHNNLSRRDYDYGYDSRSGLQTSETGSGGPVGTPVTTRTTSYYANGLARQVSENNGASVYRYEYDASGNRTLEEVTTRDGAGKLVHTITRTWYDSNNRIERATEDDLSGGTSKRVFDLSYEYDAVGNRRHIVAKSGYGPNSAEVDSTDHAPIVVAKPDDRAVRTGLAEPSEFRIRFTDVFRDAEQDELTLTITQGNGAALPAWLQAHLDAATGEIVFLAQPTGAGTVTVKLTAAEVANPAKAVSTTFTVQALYDSAPEAVATPAPTTAFRAKTGQAWAQEFDVYDYFADRDAGDSLTITVGGTRPAWLVVDDSNPSVLRLSGTPTESVAKSYPLTLYATDERGMQAARAIQINVGPNRAPQAVVSQVTSAKAVLGRSFDWSTDIAGLFKDVDGDALQVSLADGSQLPAWLLFQCLTDEASPKIRLSGLVPASFPQGNYTLLLKATDPDGASVIVPLTLPVGPNKAPHAVTPTWTAPPLRVNDDYDQTFPISMFFTDEEGDQIFIDPVWPSGSTLPDWLQVSVNQDAQTIRFHGTPTSNAQAGTLGFQLRGRDAEGLASTINASLLVGTNTAPVRNTSVRLVDQQLSIGRDFNFSLLANLFTDADGDSIRLVPQLVKKQNDDAGGWVDSSALPEWLHFDGQFTFSGTVPAEMEPGSIAIRVTAHDSTGRQNQLTSTQEANIGAAGNDYDTDFRISFTLPVNNPPVYNGGLTNRSANQGDQISWALPSDAFTDPNGDDLGYSLLVQRPGYYATDFSGTEPRDKWYPPAWVSASSVGLAIDQSTGLITGHAAAWTLPEDAWGVDPGRYTVKVIATDGSNASAEGTFIFDVNRSPVRPPLPNQTATLGKAWTYIIPAFIDPDGDALTYRIAGTPSWVHYDPATRTLSGTPLAEGSWTINVTADDGPAEASGSFVVTAVKFNARPTVVNPIPDRTIPRNAPWPYTVPSDTFADPDGDDLHLTATGLPPGVTFADGKFGGTPTTDGTYTVKVTATDDDNASVTDSFVLTVAEYPPIYHGTLKNHGVNQGDQISWALPSGAFTDPNRDALKYSLLVQRPGYYTTDFSGTEPRDKWHPPAWVSASNVGLTINLNTGLITGRAAVWTLPSGAWGVDPGRYTVKVIASDGNATAEGTFILDVNRRPVAPNVPDETIKSALPWKSDPLPKFTDPDGDQLTYPPPTGLPPGLSFNATTRVISGTPSTPGTYTVTIRAADNRATTSTSFTIKVLANHAPIAPTLTNQTAGKGADWTYTVPAFTDPDGDDLTYRAAVGLPPGLAFNTKTRVISGTPNTAGTYTVKITVDDQRGGVTTGSFKITVSAPPANRAPVLVSPIPDKWTMTGNTLSYTVASHFSDPDGNPLTYTAARTDGLAFPAWLHFDTVQGRFYGTVSGVATVDYSIRVTARDPSGLTVSDTFVLHKEGDSGSNRLMAASGPLPTDTGTTEASPLEADAGTEAGSDPSTTEQYGQGRIYHFAMGRAHAPGLQRADAPTQAVPVDADAAQDTPPQSTALVTAQTLTTTTLLAPQVKEAWFTYDAENRIAISGGQLVNHQIVLAANAAESYALGYDAVGNVTSRRVSYGLGNERVYRTAYDLRGHKALDFYYDKVGVSTGSIQTRYRYDLNGALVESTSYYAQGTWVDMGTAPSGEPRGKLDISGWLMNASSYTYNLDGRQLQQVERRRDPATNWYQLSPEKNPDVNVAQRQSTDVNVLLRDSQVDSHYDSLGRMAGYTYTARDLQDATHTYTSTYAGWEGYQEATVAGTSSNTNYRATTNTLTYDGFGRLIRQNDKTPLPSNYGTLADRTRVYSYQGEGRVLTRREGTTDSNGVFTQEADAYGRKGNYLFVQAAGQELAQLTEAGSIATPNGGIYFSPTISNLQDGDYTAAGGKVTVLAGETLQALAQRLYGNAGLWYVLADANGLSDPDAPLIAGTQLTAPDVRVTANDANTFQPYNPSEAIGPTSPGLPYITPPPKQHCNYLAMVIIIVVAIIVTIYTAGAAAGALGSTATATGTTVGTTVAGTTVGAGATASSIATAAAAAGTSSFAATMSIGATALTGGFGMTAAIVGGAVGGLVGSIASQAIGSAMGVSSFSWRSALVQGAVGGVTAGFGAAAKAGAFTKLLANSATARAATVAVVGGVTSYAASRAVGAEAHFSWRAIAASAVTAAISTKIGDELGWNPTTDAGGSGDFWHDVGNGMVSGVVGLHVRRAMGFDDRVDYLAIAADAFGNAIGNAIVRSMVGPLSRPVAGSSRGNISDRAHPSIGLHSFGGPLLNEDAPPATQVQTFEKIVVTAGGFAGTWSEYMAWLQLNHPDRYRQEQENNWAGRYNDYAAKYGYESIPNGATSAQAREIYARTVTENRMAPLQARAREEASLDHIKAVMHAPYPKSTWDLMVENSIPMLLARGAARIGDQITLTAGLGKKVPNPYLGGMEYRVGTFTDNWYTPADVQDAKFNVVTSLLSLVSVPERLMASDLRAGAEALEGLAGRQVADTSDSILSHLSPDARRYIAKYQAQYDARYAQLQGELESGRLKLPGYLNHNAELGNLTDKLVRRDMRMWLAENGATEGRGQALQVNRNFYDPEGSGAYVRPDFYLRNEGIVIDGTIGVPKQVTTSQMQGYVNFVKPNYIIEIGPNRAPRIIFSKPGR